MCSSQLIGGLRDYSQGRYSEAVDEFLDNVGSMSISKAERVVGENYDYVFDYGRYGRTWGVRGSEGEGQLRVWSNFDRYINGEIATSRTTYGFRYVTTAENDEAVIAYFESLNEDVAPNVSRGSYMNQYHIDSYHAANNDCTTIALDGLKAGIPSELYDAINNASFDQGTGLSWVERTLFSAAKDREGIVLPSDLLNSIRQHGGYDSLEEFKKP